MYPFNKGKLTIGLGLFLISQLWAQNLPLTDPQSRLKTAIDNPEYALQHWIELPIAPASKNKKIHHLGLKEAILLALRYNPNIQNAELDRIVQVYQLRLAHNEFELQYALGASGEVQRSTFSGVGSEIGRAHV